MTTEVLTGFYCLSKFSFTAEFISGGEIYPKSHLAEVAMPLQIFRLDIFSNMSLRLISFMRLKDSTFRL